jgi:hypothetical protein
MANPSIVRYLSGVIGFFDDPHALIEATEKVRDAHYRNFDVYTPYPVHGLDAAQGLKRSPIPFVTFACGLTGAALGFLLQYWTSTIDWPIIVGGKPFNSWPAFIPVMFETTILFSGLGTVAAMFFLNGLPNTRRKTFDPAVTRDRYAIVIEAPLDLEREEVIASTMHKMGKKFKPFEEAEAADFLKKIGAKDVKTVYAEGWF